MQKVRNTTRKSISGRSAGNQLGSKLLPWETLDGKPVTEIPEGAFGFVYLIEVIDPSLVGNINQSTDLSTGIIKKYIGKKQFYRTRTNKISKRELSTLPVKPGRKPTKKKTTGVSDWTTYCGSNTTLKQWVKESNYLFKRTILQYASHAKQLTSLEAVYIIKSDALFDQDNWLNANVLHRIFPGDFQNRPICKVCEYKYR